MSQTQNEKHQLELIICAKNILHAHVGFLFIHSFKQKKTIKKNEEIKTKNETNMDTSYLPQFTVGIITCFWPLPRLWQSCLVLSQNRYKCRVTCL